MIATTELITISGIELAIPSATDAARLERDQLLSAAKSISKIQSGEDAARAALVFKSLKTFAGLIESGRNEAKAPIIDLGKKLDELARELDAAVNTEADRISKTLGAYQAEQNRIAEAARQKAWEEEQRIRREAEEKERAAAEAARKEADALAQKEARARSEGKAQEYAEARRVAEERAEAERIRQQEITAAQIVNTRVAAIAPPKPAGVATRTEIKFEITDIVALYEAAPYLVKMEPNVAALKTALKGLRAGQSLPGVRHWSEAGAVAR